MLGKNTKNEKENTQGLTGIQRAMLKEGKRRIEARVGGKSESLTLEDVVTKKVFETAAAGSPHAQGHVIRQMNAAQLAQKAEIEAKAEMGRAFQRQQQRLLDKAVQNGDDVETIFPHPDDIVIDPESGYEIVGPICEEELQAVKQRCKIRDAYYIQAALEERMGIESTIDFAPGRFKSDLGCVPLVYSQLFNNSVPERYQLNEKEAVRRLMELSRQNKRELLKLAYDAWQKARKPKPRGWVTHSKPNFIAEYNLLSKQVFQLFKDMLSGEVILDSEIEARIAEIKGVNVKRSNSLSGGEKL